LAEKGGTELSKTREGVAIAAANAITVLNYAGVRFSEPLLELFNIQNLRGVRIPGADLSNAILDTVDFTNANLNGVRFVNAYMPRVNLKGAQLENAIFEDGLHIRNYQQITACCYTPNDKWLVGADVTGNLKVWQSKNWEIGQDAAW